jgi:hypothetical protein
VVISIFGGNNEMLITTSIRVYNGTLGANCGQIAVNSEVCSQKLMFYCVFGPRVLELLRFWSLQMARLP